MKHWPPRKGKAIYFDKKDSATLQIQSRSELMQLEYYRLDWPAARKEENQRFYPTITLDMETGTPSQQMLDKALKSGETLAITTTFHYTGKSQKDEFSILERSLSFEFKVQSSEGWRYQLAPTGPPVFSKPRTVLE